MEHLSLKGEKLEAPKDLDLKKIENLARVLRGLIFTALEASQSGHPGGSSSKVEQLLALLISGQFRFDPLDPKHPGRDRMVWSAGHCSPLLYGMLALIYESLKKTGKDFDPEKIGAVMGKDLLRFRHPDGPAGHVESHYPLSDLCTGASGHGLSGAVGIATAHQSSGLDTRMYVFMGDAETEEGMSYEARNIVHGLGLKNIFVNLDYNHFGIDGDINEVITTPYINHWKCLGWNVIEVDGHNIVELLHAYEKAQDKSPCVILAHGIKGKYYGEKENTSDSHGSPADHDEYVKIMKNLDFEVGDNVEKNLEVVLEQLTEDDAKYLVELINTAPISEEENAQKIKTALKGRELKDYTTIKRPEKLPEELVYSSDESVPTRIAAADFNAWLMKENAFFYIGCGDLMKSIKTGPAEDVYGVINKDNPLGRGIRFGIAEQNMAMMSAAMTQDILPGGYHPMSLFSSYGVFSSMMANPIRMTLIGNAMNPESNGFFILLAAHDGPETGEDGPTHQGLYWMSLYNAYPGIKVFKPMDANETIEMLFYAMEKQEPIALSVARPGTPVFDRTTHPEAKLATQGAYVFKDYAENGKPKKAIVICGGQTMANTLEALPEIEKQLDVKLIAVTSPELYEESDVELITDEERKDLIAIHNGWPGFLYPFLMPKDYQKRALGIDKYLKSGPPAEVYELAKLTPKDIVKKVL